MAIRRWLVPLLVLAALVLAGRFGSDPSGSPTTASSSSSSSASASSASTQPAPGAAGAEPDGAQAAEAAPATPSACPEPVSSARPIDRVAGADRYATAACASRAAYPTAVGGTVVLARGDDSGGWPDALGGTVLARHVDGPVLLTDPGRLPDATRTEVARLAPAEVLVLGGPLAVSDEVVAEVRRTVPTASVRRVQGDDRFATAVAVSTEAAATGTAFVVNGYRPADALVAGAPAAAAGAALLLVADDGVPEATAAALGSYGEIVIVGGYAVVPGHVEDRLAALVGRDHVRRVSGGNRGETAGSVARAFPAAGRAHLASGTSLVDAIAAGWSAARDGGPVLYVERDAPGPPADRYLRLGGLAPTTPARLVGGPAVLSAGLVDRLEERYAEAEDGGPAPQLRGIWVHLFDDTLKSRPGIDAMLDAAAAANLNTVVVEVARRQDAYYRSDVLPRTPDPAMPADLDLLGRLLPAAHDRGLEVHAWVPVLPAYHPVYDGLVLPVWRDHGPGSSDPWISYDANGRAGEFLDPGVPAVQDHVVAALREIAQRYPVDAIHLDYLRYSEERCDHGGRTNVVGCWGYHPAALARFRAETGTSGDPEPWDATWGEWRRAQTRQLAVGIRDAVRSVRPEAAVTMAGVTQGEPPRSASDYTNTRTWAGVFQAWPHWLADGVVDAVFPMNYFQEPRYASWFDGWVAFEQPRAGACGGCDIAVGIGAWLNPVATGTSQLRQALDATGGVVIYSYQQNADTQPYDALLAGLRAGAFAEPAPAPALR